VFQYKTAEFAIEVLKNRSYKYISSFDIATDMVIANRKIFEDLVRKRIYLCLTYEMQSCLCLIKCDL